MNKPTRDQWLATVRYLERMDRENDGIPAEVQAVAEYLCDLYGEDRLRQLRTALAEVLKEAEWLNTGAGFNTAAQNCVTAIITICRRELNR